MATTVASFQEAGMVPSVQHWKEKSKEGNKPLSPPQRATGLRGKPIRATRLPWLDSTKGSVEFSH
eukprot:1379670-Alexandrium_andersonii.AAC.1